MIMNNKPNNKNNFSGENYEYWYWNCQTRPAKPKGRGGVLKSMLAIEVNKKSMLSSLIL